MNPEIEILTKICVDCGNDFPATTKYWYKQKKGKYGLKSKCKICENARMKIYRSTPEYREYHRIDVAKRRAKDPEQYRKINRQSRERNKDRINAKNKERYLNDPEFKQKCIDRETLYKESGRRYDVSNTPEQRAKAVERIKKRRLIPEKVEEDRKIEAIWKDKNREKIRASDRKKRYDLIDSYVAQSMRKKLGNLTPEIIETRRLIIKIKRELKYNNHGNEKRIKF